MALCWGLLEAYALDAEDLRISPHVGRRVPSLTPGRLLIRLPGEAQIDLPEGGRHNEARLNARNVFRDASGGMSRVQAWMATYSFLTLGNKVLSLPFKPRVSGVRRYPHLRTWSLRSVNSRTMGRG